MKAGVFFQLIPTSGIPCGRVHVVLKSKTMDVRHVEDDGRVHLLMKSKTVNVSDIKMVALFTCSLKA